MLLQTIAALRKKRGVKRMAKFDPVTKLILMRLKKLLVHVNDLMCERASYKIFFNKYTYIVKTTSYKYICHMSHISKEICP